MTNIERIPTGADQSLVRGLLAMGADEAKIASHLARRATNRVPLSETKRDETGLEQTEFPGRGPSAALIPSAPTPHAASILPVRHDAGSTHHPSANDERSPTATFPIHSVPVVVRFNSLPSVLRTGKDNALAVRASAPRLSGPELQRGIQSHTSYTHVQERFCSSECQECGGAKVWPIVEPYEGWWRFCRRPVSVEVALEKLLARPHRAMTNHCKNCAHHAYRQRRGG